MKWSFCPCAICSSKHFRSFSRRCLSVKRNVQLLCPLKNWAKRYHCTYFSNHRALLWYILKGLSLRFVSFVKWVFSFLLLPINWPHCIFLCIQCIKELDFHICPCLGPCLHICIQLRNWDPMYTMLRSTTFCFRSWKYSAFFYRTSILKNIVWNCEYVMVFIWDFCVSPKDFVVYKRIRMSWLNSLAATTENLLNKVDQAAGHALNKDPLAEDALGLPRPQSQNFQETFNSYSPFLSAQNQRKPSANIVEDAQKPRALAGSSVGHLSTKSADHHATNETNSVSMSRNATGPKDVDSEELFEFLNSGKETDSTTKRDSRPSSSMSSRSSQSRATPDHHHPSGHNSTISGFFSHQINYLIRLAIYYSYM